MALSLTDVTTFIPLLHKSRIGPIPTQRKVSTCVGGGRGVDIKIKIKNKGKLSLQFSFLSKTWGTHDIFTIKLVFEKPFH